MRLSCATNNALVLLMMLLPSTAQHHPLEPKCEAIEVPEPVQRHLKDSRDLELSCRVKPSLIQGDFDGDGAPDYAVLVTNKTTRKRGFLIVFAKGVPVLAGAGTPVKYGSAASSDLNFDQWELYPKDRPVEAGVGEEKPLKLHGDALLVSHQESASGLFYWDGKRIRWYQQGD